MNAPMVEHDVDRIQFVETQSDHINVTVKMVSRREEEYVLVGALNVFPRAFVSPTPTANTRV